MLESGIANLTMFFVIVGMCLIFVAMWIIKSETRLRSARSEVERLKAQNETSERENFTLSEKVESMEGVWLETSPDAPSEDLLQEMYRQNQDLGNENKKLREELDEAKNSLEEVFKALSSQG